MKTDQKIVLITDGNRGIGLATASKLAERGCHVILTSRNVAAGAETVAGNQQQVPGAKVAAMVLDLASFASIRQFAEEFQAKGLPLHVNLWHQSLGAFFAHASVAAESAVLCTSASGGGFFANAYSRDWRPGQNGGKVLKETIMQDQILPLTR